MFELYLMDLTPEKRLEFLEAHGAWEVDVEDPSTFPNNWDIVPIMVFDTDDIDDIGDTNENTYEYNSVWRPHDNPPQLVEWQLTISGYDKLSQSDQDLARGIIAEVIEVFNDFEGRFSIAKDEEEDNE